MKKYILLITVISLLSVWPFFRKGFIKSDDGEWMVIRFTAFHQSLSDGQFPVRFTKRLNNNYGYPVFNFLYPAPFYISEIPKLLGFSYVNSIKITFILSAIGSSTLMFWALSKKYSALASLTGSLVYLFAPYRFVDMYTRGSLGESFAFLWPPIILGTIYALRNNERIFLPVSSFAVALLILSHNVSAVLIIPILLGCAFTCLKKSKFISYVKYTALGIAISSFFTFPALLDLRFVRLSQIKITEAHSHLVSLTELFSSPISSIFEPYSSQHIKNIGLIPIMFVIIGFLAFLNKQTKLITNYFYIILLFCLFLMTKQSKIFWELVPGVDVVQFPWRLLSVVVLAGSVITTQIVHKIQKKWFALTIIVISILSTIPYTMNMPRSINDDSYYSTNEDTTTVRDEYLPVWVKEAPSERASSAIKPNIDLYIKEEKSDTLKYAAMVDAAKKTTLTFNTIYFPGFKAKIDGTETQINYENKNGLITVELPKGTHKVIIYFGKNPVHLVSELISLFALGTALAMIYILWRKQNS